MFRSGRLTAIEKSDSIESVTTKAFRGACPSRRGLQVNIPRIFLDRITRPGEYDDEQQFAKEEAEALEDMDDLQRTEYMRAKGMAFSGLLCNDDTD